MLRFLWTLVIIWLVVSTFQQGAFTKRLYREPSADILKMMNHVIGSSPEGRIVGGEAAEPGFAPYQAGLRTNWNSLICGGVIIDENWILTAAHCVEDFPLRVLEVVVGSNFWQEPEQVLRPTVAVSHCMYDQPVFYHNDIAAVRLNESIRFGPNARAIELAEEPPKAGDVLTLTGWGVTEFNGFPPDQLYKANLTLISREDCLAAWDNHWGIDIGHLCTLSGPGIGSCNGDSGGPLVHNGRLVGLVNWGSPCALGKPDMHANVLFYRDFVNRARTQCTRGRGSR